MTTVVLPSVYHEVSLSQGTVRYREQGNGPTLVFIHGLFVNSALWRDVFSHLSQQFRCIAPDLPLGAHTIPLHPDADLSPLGVAYIVTDFLAALDLHDVTLVGNDTGGAICQLVIASYSERITRLVLTNCDAFEYFFPPLLRFLHYGARFFGIRQTNFLAWLLRARFAQRVLVATVAHRHLDIAMLDTYFTSLIHTHGVRHDVTRFMSTVSNHYTLQAAQTFPNFQHPVLIVWGKNDLFFPLRFAVRLQHAFPDAVLEVLPHSRTFIPEDQPERLAQRLVEFVHASVQ